MFFWQYCVDVLLQEAIIQILLWRLGKRTAIELVSDEEEVKLRETGALVVAAKDFVIQIAALRKNAEAKLREKQAAMPIIGGTMSRPKKAVLR